MLFLECEPKLTRGRRNEGTSSVIPADPITRIRSRCSQDDMGFRLATSGEITETVAPVSTMKFSGYSTPSSLTSPLRNPLDVKRSGSETSPSGFDLSSSLSFFVSVKVWAP